MIALVAGEVMDGDGATVGHAMSQFVPTQVPRKAYVFLHVWNEKDRMPREVTGTVEVAVKDGKLVTRPVNLPMTPLGPPTKPSKVFTGRTRQLMFDLATFVAEQDPHVGDYVRAELVGTFGTDAPQPSS
jgi:hypothetical protein